MKPMIIAALAASIALAACGSGSNTPDEQTATATKADAVPTASPSPAAATPKVDPLVGKSMPAANGTPSPDTPEQRANDLIACEAGKAAASGTPPQIPADAFEKAKARLAADPQALDKCRAG